MISSPNSNLYRHIRTFYELRPWEDLSETDIFGIREPRSGTIWFASVMGEIGITEGICFYEGPEALTAFWDFRQNDLNKPESLFTIPHFIITFETPEEIDEQQMKKTKASGPKFEKWPDIRENIPAWMPLYPEHDRLEILTTLMEQALHILRRTKKNTDFLYPDVENEDVYLIRESADQNDNEWTEALYTIEAEYPVYSIVVQTEKLALLRAKTKKPVVMQLDISLMPTPVMSEEQKLYFPLVILLIEKQKNRILGFQTIPPVPDLKTAYESLQDIIFDKLLDLSYKPFRIEVRNTILSLLLADMTENTGIEMKEVQKMENVDIYLDDLINHLNGY